MIVTQRRHERHHINMIGKTNTTQKPAPTNFTNRRRESIVQAVQRRIKIGGSVADILHKPIFGQHLKNHRRRRHRQRVATKCRPMRSRRHRRPHRRRRNHRANRKAASQTFGQSDNIGLNTAGLKREQMPGSADTRLHLISNQQRAKFIRRSARICQIMIRHLFCAAFALHRLNHHCGNMRPHRRAQRIHIAKWHMIKASRHWAKAGTKCRPVSRRQHTKGAAMKRAART